MTLAGCDLLHPHNLDGVGMGTVLDAPVPVILGDGSHCGQFMVFLVHVMGAVVRVLVQPDAEVLHL